MNSDALYSSTRLRWFTLTAGVWKDSNGTSYGADLDLQSIKDADQQPAGTARTVVWLAAGTLDIVTASAFTPGTAEPGLSMPSGTSLDVQATKIMGTSTCTSVLVMW